MAWDTSVFDVADVRARLLAGETAATIAAAYQPRAVGHTHLEEAAAQLIAKLQRPTDGSARSYIKDGPDGGR